MSTSPELPKHYDSLKAQQCYSPQWEEAGDGVGDPKAPGPSFSMVIPPPNVTGSLHMGHALNNTLQDILARYKRMDGYNVVWIPGTDHASIAVHWLVESALRKEGTSRQEIGREAFLERAWAFKETAGNRIFEQLRALGVSCDWSRTCFTLDDDRSRAVREAFKRLYDDGMIYRDETLVNWDTVAQTTVSDLEVTHDEGVEGELWHFAYPLAEGDHETGETNEINEIVVATTRPETLFGDTAIAVHPKDPRYASLVGKDVKHPLLDRTFPIIADPAVDMEFGSGAVKITPAHDFNDFAMGKRHGLEMLSVFDRSGHLNEACGKFAGLTLSKGRIAVKEAFQELGLDRGSEPHTMSIGRSERSGVVLEPMLSTQWFVRAAPLARPALAAVEHAVTRFVPHGWSNTYNAWLNNIRPWCISRQLWWGHAIPAWHCQSCQKMTVATDTPKACSHCESTQLTPDPDVLDTWFSSALWPFATMGWPEKTEDLARWYPTSVLITGFDIIFFWVARMMMFGQYFTGQTPFADIYIHALIRDSKGEKMSKTKGNVVDPLDMIETYGVDAFRMTLTAFAAQGRDVRWDEQRAAGYQKFCNKIWQAFRFAMGHFGENFDPKALEPKALKPKALAEIAFSSYDIWILSRLDHAILKLREGLDSYRFNDVASALHGFIWDELCDWYLELVKGTLYGEELKGDAAQAKQAVLHTLWIVFSGIARLMHPIMPYLAEELWQRLPATSGSILEQSYPKLGEGLSHVAVASKEEKAADVETLKAVITATRRLRAEFGVPAKSEVVVHVRGSENLTQMLYMHRAAILSLAKADLALLKADAEAPKGVVTEVVGALEVMLLLTGVVDFESETARLSKEEGKALAEIKKLESQLNNEKFIGRAPEAVVEDKKAQLLAAQSRRGRLQEALSRLAAA